MTRHYAPQTDSCAEQPPTPEPLGVAHPGPRVLAAVGLLRLRHRQTHQLNVQPDGAHLQKRRGAPGDSPAAPRRRAGQPDHRRRPPQPPRRHAVDDRRLRHRHQELRNLRYDDGLPVPADRIAKLAADTKILPAIFNTAGDPLWLGRARRDASAGQRIVLAARDGGCINCASPVEGTEPHHIGFSRGGPTDIDNLTLLCERCHHLVHDDVASTSTTADSGCSRPRSRQHSAATSATPAPSPPATRRAA